MSELVVSFDPKVKALKNEEIKINVESEISSSLKYRFFEGRNSIWNPITEFQEENSCTWVPNDTGRFMIMVQAKEIQSTKTFDYTALKHIQIKEIEDINNELDDEVEDSLEDVIHTDDNDVSNDMSISDVILEKTKYLIGEKVNIIVKTSVEPALIRMWRKAKSGWEPLKDYNLDNKFSYTAINEGREEILIECKNPNSENDIDDYKTVTFKVEKLRDIQIADIKCMTDNLVVNEELVFKIHTNCENKRSLLYKYYLGDKEGNVRCIQDYSSYDIVSFKVKEKGEYKVFCLIRDMFSNNSYDDRAVINFNVKSYEDIKIKRFASDLVSPQLAGTSINLVANATGGRQLVYRYIIEGPFCEDSGYIRNSNYIWVPENAGSYEVTLQVKDISSNEDYEAKETLTYQIDKKGEKPVRIVEVIKSNSTSTIINEPIKISAKAEGGTALKYSFIVFKNGVEEERVDFGSLNWVKFIPTEKGSYEIEIRIKDKYSKKEYDANSFVSFNVKEFVPAKIDYLIKSYKDCYIVGDNIDIEAVCRNTTNVLVRYVTKIDGREVEDTGYVKFKKLTTKPRCPGKYTIEVYAKSVESDVAYDDKSKINIYVSNAIPVHDTEISCDREQIVTNKEVTFNVDSKGGKDVCYEFYIMEKGNWVKMQSYSKKKYYTFLPFVAGEYRLLVLSKSFYKKVHYEDYAEFKFIVERI